MRKHGIRLAFALILVIFALAVPDPARAICPWQWACYDGCDQSAVDCYGSGGGEECGEQWSNCYAICNSMIC